MTADREGFLYPQIDSKKCVHCGLCESVCPEMGYIDRNESLQAMAIQCKSENDRARSTAGGGFAPIAEYVLDKGGVVYGAAYDETFTVRHIGIESKDNLPLLLGSKYVQSVIGDTYRQTGEQLKQGRWVAFSGTPCQIVGLNRYLECVGCDCGSERLVTISVVCRAVPSPYIFKKYVEYQQEKFGGSVKSICCRDKHYGYAYSTMSVYSETPGKYRDYHCSAESDEWLRCFFSGVCDRPCCEDCRFKGPVGDFHIGDYFRVGQVAPELNDNRGTTRMIIGSRRGQAVFEEIKDRYRFHEVSVEQLHATAQNALTDFGRDKGKREQFFDDARKLTGRELFSKYYPRTVKIRVLQYGRYICYRLGIYDALKRMLLKVKCRG